VAGAPNGRAPAGATVGAGAPAAGPGAGFSIKVSHSNQLESGNFEGKRGHVIVSSLCVYLNASSAWPTYTYASAICAFTICLTHPT
jgi:hypothetical protein